jgi:hypothetical protein
LASIDFLFLANHVELQNGLLYASGAGWSDLYRLPDEEGRFSVNHFGIAVSVAVPWDETNQPHHLILRIEQEDETEVSRVETDVEVGRPPRLPAGSVQRVVLGLGVDTVFPTEGGYRFVATIDEDTRSVDFRVHDQPRPQF